MINESLFFVAVNESANNGLISPECIDYCYRMITYQQSWLLEYYMAFVLSAFVIMFVISYYYDTKALFVVLLGLFAVNLIFLFTII